MERLPPPSALSSEDGGNSLSRNLRSYLLSYMTSYPDFRVTAMRNSNLISPIKFQGCNIYAFEKALLNELWMTFCAVCDQTQAEIFFYNTGCSLRVGSKANGNTGHFHSSVIRAVVTN